MAFRAVVKRGKTLACKGWHNYRRDSGIPSAISIINRSIFPNHGPCLSIPLLNLSCRHYYLPPAPSFCYRPDVGPKAIGGCGDVFAVADLLGEASPFAQFALMMQNKTQNRNLRFVRVVRASFSIFRGNECYREYYLTLEAIDEKGDSNVYYAEVRDLNEKHLVKWELVDESFRYPYFETRVVLIWRCINNIIERHYGLRPDEIFNYAVDALEVLEKKAGKSFLLEEVLDVIEEKVDEKAFYILWLKAMNDRKELCLIYAVFEASETEEDLVKWHAVDELASGPRKKNLVAYTSGLEWLKTWVKTLKRIPN